MYNKVIKLSNQINNSIFFKKKYIYVKNIKINIQLLLLLQKKKCILNFQTVNDIFIRVNLNTKTKYKLKILTKKRQNKFYNFFELNTLYENIKLDKFVIVSTKYGFFFIEDALKFNIGGLIVLGGFLS